MSSLLKFNKRYFIIAVGIFVIEVVIALFIHDKIIRPYLGDFLVVILIYCFVKSFLNTPVFPTALAVLLFSYTVEISQYFHLVNCLGLQNSKFARTIIGTSFEWIDLATYTAGIVVLLIIEIIFAKRKYPK
jgi:hypothetical protein